MVSETAAHAVFTPIDNRIIDSHLELTICPVSSGPKWRLALSLTSVTAE